MGISGACVKDAGDYGPPLWGLDIIMNVGVIQYAVAGMMTGIK